MKLTPSQSCHNQLRRKLETIFPGQSSRRSIRTKRRDLKTQSPAYQLQLKPRRSPAQRRRKCTMHSDYLKTSHLISLKPFSKKSLQLGEAYWKIASSKRKTVLAPVTIVWFSRSRTPCKRLLSKNRMFCTGIEIGSPQVYRTLSSLNQPRTKVEILVCGKKNLITILYNHSLPSVETRMSSHPR